MDEQERSRPRTIIIARSRVRIHTGGASPKPPHRRAGTFSFGSGLPCRQHLEVRAVLVTARRALVLQEGLESDDRNPAPLQLERRTFRDRLIEADSSCTSKNVDAARWQSDLEHALVLCEIDFLYFKGLEGCSEGGEGTIDPPSVRRVGADKYVKILGGSRVTVESDRMPSDNYEIGTGVVKLNEKIAEVLRKLDHGAAQVRNDRECSSANTVAMGDRTGTSSLG